MFNYSMKNYGNVNFLNLKRLKINGHLNYYEVNNVTQKELVQSIV